MLESDSLSPHEVRLIRLEISGVVGVRGSQLGEGREQPDNIVLGAIVNDSKSCVLMGTRRKTAATPPTTMNRTFWRVRTSIS
jgi:hypothetical protein